MEAGIVIGILIFLVVLRLFPELASYLRCLIILTGIAILLVEVALLVQPNLHMVWPR